MNARTQSAVDLADRIRVAQRLQAEGRRPQARAPQERTYPLTRELNCCSSISMPVTVKTRLQGRQPI